MIIVTGGAGFIGSQIVARLNQQERDDIIIVDDLTNGHKFKNLVGLKFLDYVDKDDFLPLIKQNYPFSQPIDAIIHQGACSTTTEWDGKMMMAVNYEYSKQLFHYCVERELPFIYASSAAIYGGSDHFSEDPQHELPLNVYGYSKLQFDNYVRRYLAGLTSQVVGLRYFNVYGPGEEHKESMASVAFHLNNQLKATGVVKLFEGCGGFSDGEQLRDFIYVEDVVSVVLWFLANCDKSGIYNVGTGRAQSFNDVAKAVIEWHGKGQISYIPFPEHLKGAYQSYTQADLTRLRSIGYNQPFCDVHTGIFNYLDRLNTPQG